MVSLKGFSQSVTETKTDTTKVVLSVKTARLVYQDLLRYDGIKEELKLTNLKLEQVLDRENQKDTIINLLTKKDENNQFIISQKDEQLKVSKELSNSLNKELKGQRFKTFMWKVGTFAGIVTSTLLLINR